MENPYDKTRDVNAWAEREHTIKLHETVQSWGEAALPLLYDETSDDISERRAFFELLMQSVESEQTDLARLIRERETTMIESTRSWYTGELGSLSAGMREEMIRRHFLTLFKIYKAGHDLGKEESL